MAVIFDAATLVSSSALRRRRLARCRRGVQRRSRRPWVSAAATPTPEVCVCEPERCERCDRRVRFTVAEAVEEAPIGNRCRSRSEWDLESMVAAFDAKCMEDATTVASTPDDEDNESSEETLCTDDNCTDVNAAAREEDVRRELSMKSIDEDSDSSEETSRAIEAKRNADASTSTSKQRSDEESEFCEATSVPKRQQRRVRFSEADLKDEAPDFVGSRPRSRSVVDLDAWFAHEDS